MQRLCGRKFFLQLMVLGAGMGDLAPVQISSGQSLNQHFRRCQIGGDGHVVLVAEAADVGQVGLVLLILGEEK